MNRDSAIKGVLFILLFTFALGIFMVDVWDPDFWWHLATGRWIVEHGTLPGEDPFSFATLQKDPFASTNRVKFILTQYWLAQVILYKIYSFFGFAGISVFRALVLTLTIGMTVLIMRRNKVPVVLILPIAALSVLMLRAFAGERPQLFSFLFAAILLYLLEKYKSSELGVRSQESGVGSSGEQKNSESGVRSSETEIHKSEFRTNNPELITPNRYSLYAIPFLMALWANLHGGYIYGVVTILIYISSGWLNIFITRLRGKRELAIELQTPNSELRTPDSELKTHILFTAVGIVAIAATCINPNSYHGIIDHFRYRPMAYFISIQEMRPAHNFVREHAVYFCTLALLAVVMLIDALRHKRVDGNHVLLFLFNAALSLSAVRFVSFFVISGSFLLGIYLKPFLPLRAFERRKWLEGAALVAFSLIFSAFAFFVEGVSVKHFYRTGVHYGSYPYRAVQFLKTLPPGKIFNPYTWGGYLIWSLYPEPRIFIDGRGLNEEVFLQYGEVTLMVGSQHHGGMQDSKGMPKWKAILEGYHIDYLLLAPLMEFASDWALISAVAGDDDWRLIYTDNGSVIFVRNKEKFREVIQRYSLPPDLAYATISWQAIEKAKVEKRKEKKVEYYLIAADTFIKMKRTKNAQASLDKVLELDPENPAAKMYEKMITKE